MPEREATLRVGFVIEERSDITCVLTTGRFNLDQVCAQIGHELAAELALFIGQLQHPESVQRSGIAVVRAGMPAVISSGAHSDATSSRMYGNMGISGGHKIPSSYASLTSSGVKPSRSTNTSMLC